MNTTLNYNKIVIVGLGLMGASLAQDIKTKKIARYVYGLDRSKKHLDFCLKAKIIHKAFTHFEDTLASVDMVILALPVRANTQFLKQYGSQLSRKTCVMDVGSTKSQILKTALSTLKHKNFVGCHPMAGTEKSGPFTAQPGLFKNKTCFLLKSRATSLSFMKQAQKFWSVLGAQVVIQDEREHDQIMASISHLPQLLATLLSQAVLSQSRTDIHPQVKKGCREFLGGGFKDMIRIASSPSEMWRDIFLENSKHLSREVKRFAKLLREFEIALSSQDAESLERFMKTGAELRNSL